MSSNNNLKKLFIHNIPYEATERDVEDLFSKFGKIANVQIPKHTNGKSKGYKF